MPNGKICFTVINEDGNESSKEVTDGTKVSTVIGKGKACILNGREVRAGRDPELREGDRIIIVRRSYKNG